MDENVTVDLWTGHPGVTRQSIHLDTSKRMGLVPTTIYTTIGLIGILGNGFVITVLASSEKMRQKLVNVLLISQSVVDLTASVFTIACGPNKENVRGDFAGLAGQLYCRVWAPKLPMWAAFTVSSYNLVLVNTERYLSITRPIFHKVGITTATVVVAIMVVWVTGILENCLFTIPTSTVLDGVECSILSEWPSNTVSVVAGVMNTLFQFVIPLVAIVFMYAHMTMILKRKIEPEVDAPNDGVSGAQGERAAGVAPRVSRAHGRNMTRARRNLIKTVVIVTALFAFCWVWNSIYILLYLFGFVQLEGSFYNFTEYVLFLNCCVNPFVYAAQYREFQLQVMKLFCRNKVHPIGSTHAPSQHSNSMET